MTRYFVEDRAYPVRSTTGRETDMTDDRNAPNANETEDERVDRQRRENRRMLDDIRSRTTDSAIDAANVAATVIASTTDNSSSTDSSSSSSCD